MSYSDVVKSSMVAAACPKGDKCPSRNNTDPSVLCDLAHGINEFCGEPGCRVRPWCLYAHYAERPGTAAALAAVKKAQGIK